MSKFTPAEIEYLQSQRLGRLATVNEKGDPHVVPVGYRYNAELDTIDIGGHNIVPTKKYREAVRHGRVAFVVDDVLPPWKPRGIEVRGRAQALPEGGKEIMKDFARRSFVSSQPISFPGGLIVMPSTPLVGRWNKKRRQLFRSHLFLIPHCLRQFASILCELRILQPQAA